MPARFSGTIFHLFRSRAFCVAMLAFQFLWLNVIVPGHRRGVVSLPGEQCSECAGYVAKAAQPCCADLAHKHVPVPVDPASHCAICFFAARLSPVVALDFTHPPLRLIGPADRPRQVIAHCPEFTCTYLGRGPPVVG